MTIIDADKFLAYLIFSKYIDGLTCGEVKEAIEMCKVDVLDKIRAEIEEYRSTIDRAISEDELKIEGMKEAYTNCLEILDSVGKEVNIWNTKI